MFTKYIKIICILSYLSILILFSMFDALIDVHVYLFYFFSICVTLIIFSASKKISIVIGVLWVVLVFNFWNISMHYYNVSLLYIINLWDIIAAIISL